MRLASRTTIAILSTAIWAASPASAETEQARVISATPIYETVRTPQRREVCWDEEITYRERGGSRSGPVVGTIIGGAVGNQFGGGRGRDALTVAGAILGHAVAKDVQRSNARTYSEVETRCRTETDYVEQDRLRGYNVEYEYNGEIYATRTRTEPGDWIDVRVSVTPVAAGY